MDDTQNIDAGTAPAADTPSAPDTPSQDVNAPTPEGGTSEQVAPAIEFAERYDPASIEDPQIRAQVELYAKQLQGDYTRKTQELAAQRREAQQAIDLMTRLQDEESRDQAFGELLESLGMELADDEPDTPDTGTGLQEGGDDPTTRRLAELEARLAAREAAEQQAAEAQARAQREGQVLEHVDQALDGYAEQQGVEELDPRQRRAILAFAAASAPDEHGMPDMQGAIAEYEAMVAGAVQHYLASKQVATPDASGSSGQPNVDLRDEKSRLAMANAIAERALARHA